MTVIEAIGYFNAALGVAMLAMQTMIPLRLAGIAHNIVSIGFGFATGIYPMLLQHAILLPINALRLFEMLRLIRQVQAASAGNLAMDWIKPFTNNRKIGAGEILFRKDDPADGMYYVVSGKLRLREIGVVLESGAVVGELGFLSPDAKRTLTVECLEDAVLLSIGYDRLEQLYFQNPEFGIYFLKLTTARLFENIGRLEETVGARDREIARLQRLVTAEKTP